MNKVAAGEKRREVELVYRQARQTGPVLPDAPDCGLTPGAIAKKLKGAAGRLDAIGRVPALASTSAGQPSELRRELHHIGEDARSGLAHSQAQLDGTVRDLRGMIGSARVGQDQQQWLWMAGVCGAMAGVLLWFMLPWAWRAWPGAAIGTPARR